MSETDLTAVELIIFGVAGDLTWRKLMPALYNLFLDNLLPEKFAIFGVDAKSLGLDELQQRLLDGVNQFSRRGKAKADQWKKFSSHVIACQAGDFNDRTTFEKLGKSLSTQEKSWGDHAERVFYLATPPTIVETIVHNLGVSHIISDRNRARLVFEKPFGHNLDSARRLNQVLLKTLKESQIYRIDHYLGIPLRECPF